MAGVKMTAEQRAQAVKSLTALLEAIDRGEVDSTETVTAYLTGARDSTAMIADEWFPPPPARRRARRS
jgi:hypothetical protein